MAGRFSPKTALVTGASSGIGTEFARLLAERGCGLVLTGRNRNRLKCLAGELKNRTGVSVTVIAADLSKPGAAEKLFGECRRRRLDIDFLVNNAGAAVFGHVIDQKPGILEDMIALNVSSLTTLCRLFGKQMSAKKRGAILNVGSVIGYMAAPYFASYAATKSYVYSFSLALASELKKSGVTVTCLLPGYVRTNFDANAGIASRSYAKFSERNSMTAARVARIGIDASLRGRTRAVAGFRNNLFALAGKFFPRRFVAGVMEDFLGRMKD